MFSGDLKINYVEKYIEKILDETVLKRQDIQNLLDETKAELNGLVSDEGCLFIILKKLGLRDEEEKRSDILLKILDAFDCYSNSIRSFFLGDEKIALTQLEDAIISFRKGFMGLELLFMRGLNEQQGPLHSLKEKRAEKRAKLFEEAKEIAVEWGYLLNYFGVSIGDIYYLELRMKDIVKKLRSELRDEE